MKNKKIVLIVVAIIIVLVAIISIVVLKNRTNKQNELESMQNIANNNVGEFAILRTDGTKVNISEQLNKTKTIDGLEISNITLTEKENVSRILADVKNPTSDILGGINIKITILDKEGNETLTIGGYIDKVEPGKTVRLNASATADFANAYDFKVSK